MRKMLDLLCLVSEDTAVGKTTEYSMNMSPGGMSMYDGI